VIEGIKTTIPFHLQLMRNEDFKSGNFTTKFLDTFKMDWFLTLSFYCISFDQRSSKAMR